MEGEAPSQHVCALNTRARLLGIAHGMTRVEVDTFPATVLLPRSASAEATARAILLECAGTFSPRVEDCSLTPERSPGTTFLCVLDIAGTQSLLGPPEMLARNLLRRVRALGISARVAVSSNFHAAICLARARSATAPVQVVAPGEEASALEPLPLTVLDLTALQAETFALWGISTLGMLAALPEDNLMARMGQDGRRLHQAARGELPHLFQPVEPVFSLEERIELDTPVDLLESLLFGIGLMLEQHLLRARARILALASATVTLTLEGGGVHTRTVRPALPSNDKQLWLKLLHLDLVAHPPPAAVLAIALYAEPGSTTTVQLGLFSPQLPEAARLDVTLARIRALVGDDNVGRAALQDSHAPESFRMEPFSIPPGSSAAEDAAEAEPPQSRACLRRLRPPEPASVTLRNARPAMFFFRERRFTVERAYGPWLAGGEWWNQTLWGFEQWDLVVRGQDGCLLCCCLMRDLMHNRWQMAALYD
jgi:protein ImuB